MSRPDQRDRRHAGFHEVGRRLAAARPDLLVTFVNDALGANPCLIRRIFRRRFPI